MSRLQSFSEELNVAVIGASGGIGSALVELLRADDRVAVVHALSRSPDYAIEGKVWPCPIEITKEATIRNAAERVTSARPLDLVIVATGILHAVELRPEKTMRELEVSAMSEVFAINTIGPAILAKHFLPNMRRRGKSVFAALSARVGSIGDNRLGGWVSYRASKAALNMTIRTMAIERTRSRPDTIVAALHPGTVDTPLSKPFQGRVPRGKLFAPPAAADYLLRVIDNLAPRDSGGFFAWDGSAIEF